MKDLRSEAVTSPSTAHIEKSRNMVLGPLGCLSKITATTASHV
jgi:hypothetical protein